MYLIQNCQQQIELELQEYTRSQKFWLQTVT